MYGILHYLVEIKSGRLDYSSFFGLKARGRLIEILEEQDYFSRINITLLKGFYSLPEIKLLSQVYPASVYVELFDLVLEVRALISFLKENDVCLLNPAYREQELNLLFRRYFHHLMNLR